MYNPHLTPPLVSSFYREAQEGKPHKSAAFPPTDGMREPKRPQGGNSGQKIGLPACGVWHALPKVIVPNLRLGLAADKPMAAGVVPYFDAGEVFRCCGQPLIGTKSPNDEAAQVCQHELIGLGFP